MGIGSSRAPVPPPGQPSHVVLGGGDSRHRVHSQVQPDAGPSGSGLHHHHHHHHYHHHQQQGGRHRSRSLDFLSDPPVQDSDEDTDSEEDGPVVSGGPRPQRPRGVGGGGVHVIRQHLGVPSSFYRADIRCPVCSKTVPHDDIEMHLVVCLTKPRISYNEDVLTEDKGAECAICLEDLCQGETIARLPCLCIYHKGCIDDWFKRSRSCPEHPGDG